MPVTIEPLPWDRTGQFRCEVNHRLGGTACELRCAEMATHSVVTEGMPAFEACAGCAEAFRDSGGDALV